MHAQASSRLSSLAASSSLLVSYVTKAWAIAFSPAQDYSGGLDKEKGRIYGELELYYHQKSKHIGTCVECARLVLRVAQSRRVFTGLSVKVQLAQHAVQMCF